MLLFSSQTCIPRNGTFADMCGYLTDHCTDLADRYLEIYYCHQAGHPLIADITLATVFIITIIFLFFALGMLASDYLTPNLTFLSTLLHLDEKMAGLTLVALANGAPDISSTYAAMSSDSTTLAMGELLGSANFVLTMVIGCMALVNPFQVDYSTILRDLALFGLLIAMSMAFLSDGKITLAESIAMVTLYFVFILINWLEPEPMLAMVDELPITDDAASVGSPVTLSRTHLTQNVENIEQGRSYRLSLVDSFKLAVGSWKKHAPQREEESYTVPAIGKQSNDTDVSSIPIISVSDDVVTYDAVNSPDVPDDPHLLSPSPPLLIPSRSCSSVSSVSSSRSIILSAAHLPINPYRPESNVLLRILPPLKNVYSPGNPWETALNVLIAPFSSFFNLCIPVPIPPEISDIDRQTEKTVNLKLFLIQVFLFPLLFQSDLSLYTIAFSCGILALILFFQFALPNFYSKIFEPLAALVGFLSVLDLIAKTASGIVKILKDAGAVYEVKESLLGLTVLSLGNCVGDLVTNTTLASLGFAMTGLHACFGSPLLYTLFGIGLNSIIVILTKNHGPILFEVDTDLKITACSIIFTLIFYAITIPCMGWKVNRIVGGIAVLIWITVMGLNVYY
ncbi:DEKNAAC101067 [Brettanomyces naardenensis]|uniref:DEKNAAC101067 n=1 Tax=Brettanomyces naardenensis TaxID=13370 RepID=A0A448YGV4_BRENA|nr:DEKNAAC101067 [Brettanomyces naardenensis]